VAKKRKKKNFEVIFFFLKETTGINSLMEAILNFCPPDDCRTMKRIKEMKREMSSRGKKKKKNGDWKKKTKEKEKGKSFKSSHD
jgi:hypothetical protein